MTDPNEAPTRDETPDPENAGAGTNAAGEDRGDLSGGAINENVTSGPPPEGAPVSQTGSATPDVAGEGLATPDVAADTADADPGADADAGANADASANGAGVAGASATATTPTGRVPATAPEDNAADAGATDDGAADEPDDSEDAIAGTSVLRGLLLYAAVLAFAALYIDFIVQILSRTSAGAPTLNTAMVGTAAALAGVLGSAFALNMGVAARPVNTSLKQHIDRETKKAAKTHTKLKMTFALFLHKALSVEPGGKKDKSWPLTFGIWAYAIVGSAVALTYIFNQGHTPDAIKALAVTFAGYILALIHNAFGSSSSA